MVDFSHQQTVTVDQRVTGLFWFLRSPFLLVFPLDCPISLLRSGTTQPGVQEIWVGAVGCAAELAAQQSSGGVFKCRWGI